MRARRITVTIDRLVCDRDFAESQGLTRTALVEALSEAVRDHLATHGPAALGPGRTLEQVSGQVPPVSPSERVVNGAREPLASAVARAAVGAVAR